jgi:hypothetical protein
MKTDVNLPVKLTQFAIDVLDSMYITSTKLNTELIYAEKDKHLNPLVKELLEMNKVMLKAARQAAKNSQPAVTRFVCLPGISDQDI